MYKVMIKELVFTVLFLLSANAHADTPPVVLEDGKEFYEIGLNLDILEDPSGKLTIDDVNRFEWAGKFKKSQKKVLSFGFTDSVVWVRLSSKNHSTIKSWVLEIMFPDLDEISFFKKK